MQRLVYKIIIISAGLGAGIKLAISFLGRQ